MKKYILLCLLCVLCGTSQAQKIRIKTGIPDIEIEELDINTKYNDFIITGLRTMWGIRTADIRERFGEEKQTYLEQQAATYLRQGLLIRENDTLTLSKKGIFISDGIMSDLLWV